MIFRLKYTTFVYSSLSILKILCINDTLPISQYHNFDRSNNISDSSVILLRSARWETHGALKALEYLKTYFELHHENFRERQCQSFQLLIH